MNEAPLERKIVAAALKNRSAYSKIAAVGEFDQYTPYTAQILKLAGEFYEKDPDAKKVDVEVIEAWLTEKVTPKNLQLFTTFLKEASGADVSAVNIAELVVFAKKSILKQRMAVALMGPDEAKAIELIEEFRALTSKVEEPEEDEVVSNVTIEQRLKMAADMHGRIRLLPQALDRAVKGKTRPGHHLVLFARPETGKTAETLTLAYGFCLQGLSTIIFGNEEPVEDTWYRAQSTFTGMTEEEIEKDPQKATALLEKRNWRLLRFIPINPGTPKEIERYVEKYKPDCIIVDQIRNLNVGGETRVNQLEMAATSMRNLGKRHSVVVVSVTQAGDSADNKLVLGMGDIDFSNTGIPATADLMLGMGVNGQYEMEGLRMFSTPKNKIGGTHTNFAVKLRREISRVEDVGV